MNMRRLNVEHAVIPSPFSSGEGFTNLIHGLWDGRKYWVPSDNAIPEVAAAANCDQDKCDKLKCILKSKVTHLKQRNVWRGIRITAAYNETISPLQDEIRVLWDGETLWIAAEDFVRETKNAEVLGVNYALEFEKSLNMDVELFNAWYAALEHGEQKPQPTDALTN